VAAWLALLPGCGSPKPPAYQDAHGFHVTPPPGWVERARDDALAPKGGHRPSDPPLPRLNGSGAASERLLVRYDRLTAGRLAWVRVTVADLPAAQPLPAVLAAYAPGTGWKRAGEVESLEVSGHPAARVAFTGVWGKQDYLCETAAVRAGERVYFVSASFPAADETAREQVRRVVEHATWPKASD
jgi:hypothetical protein